MVQNAFGDIAAIAMFVLVVAAAECGFFAARRLRDRAINVNALEGVRTSMFAILALLLAFTFSLAQSRFDLRREAVVREASAISTAIVRADVLDARDRVALREELGDYTLVRIAFVEAASNQSDQQRLTEESRRRLAQMWTLGIIAARSNERPQLASLALQALNDVADASANEAAVAEAHIPDTVLAILFAIAALTAGIAAFNAGLHGGRSIAFVIYALVLALVIIAIVDMDRPQAGLIRVDVTPLQQAIGASTD